MVKAAGITEPDGHLTESDGISPRVDDALREALKRILGRREGVESFLDLHQGMTDKELLSAAMALADERKVNALQKKKAGGQTELKVLRERVLDQNWKDLLIEARATILCRLPHRQTDKKQVVKTTRLKSGQTLRVIYTAQGAYPLPFGKDRAVLSVITTAASRSKSPTVRFDSAMEFMNAFGLTDSGTNYKHLADSINRLKSFSIYISIDDGRYEATSNGPVVRRAGTPSQVDYDVEKTGQSRLPFSSDGFYVELDPSFFDEILRHGVPIPLELMRRYANNPLGWDFITWLNYRIKMANGPSRIPLETLSTMLGSTDDNLRKIRMKIEAILKDLREVWPECAAHFEGRGLAAVLFVDKPKDGRHLVMDRKTLKNDNGFE